MSASSAEVGARHYLYAEDGQLLAEHDATTGALLREYVWLDTMPLAMVTGPAATPSYTWITTGNLNEPLLLTSASGAVVSSVTRDPWGNPILLAGGSPLDLGYPGQWRDAATGLFQNWHRDYDPTLGRYIEADPLGLGGGSNLFAYVGGDPVNVTDPDGRNPVRGAVVVGEAVGGGLIWWCRINIALCMRTIGPAAIKVATVCGAAFEMAKGGDQNKENEWSRAAKREQPGDPCEWLKREYDDPSTSPADRQKIKTAQKFLGCRRRG